MGADKSEANMEVAKLENEVIRYEQDYTETYAGFDPNSPEMSIIFGMLQYANFESSLDFARLVQERFGATTPLRNRGAKQGPFAVLWKPTMPRVLVEMGFISNATDRNYIFSDRGRNTIVRALFDALSEYRRSLDSGNGSNDGYDAPMSAATPPPAPARAARIASDNTPYTAFYIQLAATKTRVSVNDSSWGEYRGEVIERRIDGWYKYQLGPYFTNGEATAKLREVKRTKFDGAFIVEAATN
jgi:N-acetylmuramoyl-L-alanine amidase